MSLGEELKTHVTEGELKREKGLDLRMSTYFCPGWECNFYRCHLEDTETLAP